MENKSNCIFRKALAELLGTFIFVFIGCGSIIFTCSKRFTQASMGTRVLVISLAFGFAYIAAAYSLGKISGCHLNPAVSLAMLINKKITFAEFIAYVISQFVGAFAGSFALAGIMTFTDVINASSGLGQTGYANRSSIHISSIGALAAELIFTFILVIVFLGATSENGIKGYSGIAVGMTVSALNLVGYLMTGASANPARSFGPAAVLAIFDHDTLALSHLWVFICAPLVGAVIAGLAHRFIFADKN